MVRSFSINDQLFWEVGPDCSDLPFRFSQLQYPMTLVLTRVGFLWFQIISVFQCFEYFQCSNAFELNFFILYWSKLLNTVPPTWLHTQMDPFDSEGDSSKSNKPKCIRLFLFHSFLVAMEMHSVLF
jgi:hypothetical protein